MKAFKIQVVAGLLFLMGGAMGVYAAETLTTPGGNSQGNPMSACQADAQAYCGSVQPGHGGVGECLSQNELKLTPDCQTAVTQMKKHPSGRAGSAGGEVAACKEDVQKLCGNVPPGHGGMMQCLSQNESKLSPSCQSAVAQMKQRHSGVEGGTNPCIEDRMKFCKDVPPGQGRGMHCMHDHMAQLTPACQQKIQSMMQGHPNPKAPQPSTQNK